MQISNSKKMAFVPFTITIEIETPQDLATLYHMANVSDSELQRNSKISSRLSHYPPNVYVKSQLFHHVEKLAITCGMRDK